MWCHLKGRVMLLVGECYVWQILNIQYTIYIIYPCTIRYIKRHGWQWKYIFVIVYRLDRTFTWMPRLKFQPLEATPKNRLDNAGMINTIFRNARKVKEPPKKNMVLEIVCEGLETNQSSNFEANILGLHLHDISFHETNQSKPDEPHSCKVTSFFRHSFTKTLLPKSGRISNRCLSYAHHRVPLRSQEVTPTNKVPLQSPWPCILRSLETKFDEVQIKSVQ